jgi:parvulin-like peptidyl-prolyl isomerase
MGKESKIRQLRREGKIEPIHRVHRMRRWLKILIIAILVFALTLTGLGIWGYVERNTTAWVGKETISNSEVQNELDYYVNMYKQYGMDLTSAQYASTLKSLKNNILQGLIEESLLVQYAKAHNITIDQDKYNTNMQQQVQQVIDQGEQNNGKQQFEDLVTAQFGSMDAYKTYLEGVLKPYVERPLYKQAVLDEQYKTINITDQDVKDYFNSLWEVDAEHLLVEFPTNATSKQKSDVKTVTDDVYTKLVAAESTKDFNFATFAKTEADDLNKQQASTGQEVARYEALGYFAKGQMVKAFEDACFAPGVKVGDILGPIETDYGYHFIHILGKKTVSEQYDQPVQVDVRLVQFNFTSGDQKSEDSAKTSANSIAIQTKNGMNFIDAVKKFSQDDTTKANDGETGYFSSNDKPELFAAAEKLSVGGIAGPIKTSTSYDVIQLIGKKAAVKASLSDKDTFDKVKADLLSQKQQELEQTFTDSLKKVYHVRTTNPWRSLTAFVNDHFGSQINSFVTWWNNATGHSSTTNTNTNGSSSNGSSSNGSSSNGSSGNGSSGNGSSTSGGS